MEHILAFVLPSRGFSERDTRKAAVRSALRYLRKSSSYEFFGLAAILKALLGQSKQNIPQE